jgi:hypothetical protein
LVRAGAQRLHGPSLSALPLGRVALTVRGQEAPKQNKRKSAAGCPMTLRVDRHPPGPRPGIPLVGSRKGLGARKRLELSSTWRRAIHFHLIAKIILVLASQGITSTIALTIGPLNRFLHSFAKQHWPRLPAASARARSYSSVSSAGGAATSAIALAPRNKAAIGAVKHDGDNNVGIDGDRTDAPDADRTLRSGGENNERAPGLSGTL